MKDLISVNRINQLHPLVISLFQEFINEIENSLDLTIRIVQGLRTDKEQQALYDQSRVPDKTGKLKPWATNAKAGESFHNYGLAVDLVPMQLDLNRKFQPQWNFNFLEIKPIADKYGITWGGTFSKPDPDHFEFNFSKGPSGWSYFKSLPRDPKGYVVIPDDLVKLFGLPR